MTNTIIIIILVALILANGFKGTERVSATLKITSLYHSAREKNPEALGSNPENVRKKVQGVLQKTIWAAFFHFANVLVCAVLVWKLSTGRTSPMGSWRRLVLLISLISALGSTGAIVELACALFQTLRVDRMLVKLSPEVKKDQPPVIQMCIVVLLGIAQYALTGVAAGYLMVTLYRSGG